LAINTKDSLLLAWASTADALLASSPSTYGTTAAVATAFHAVYQPYADAMAALQDDAQKNKSAIALKDQCKKALLDFARPLYATIKANNAVTYQAKVDMGIHVNSPPSRVPAPVWVPKLEVASVYGRNVRLRILNPLTGKRGKPSKTVAGVSLFSFVGENPPTAAQAWQAEGNVGGSDIVVQFPESVEPSSVVWFTGFYYTARGLSGESCTPISARIGFEGAEPLSA
jgi:hypothetical protein